ncbi:MAG TPA: hypothetical protein VGI81_03055 [Tepidisphaeraceae bacterium]|jgi:hypothetical protein
MKHVVCGICRTTGLITTREVEAADAVAAASIASGELIVFEVEPAQGQRPRLPDAARAAALSPIGDAGRRLSFVLSMLILAGLLAWSAYATAPARPRIGSSAHPAIVLTAHPAATRPAPLPPLARAAEAKALPATPVTLSH